MVTEEKTLKEDVDFQYIYASLFTLSVAQECLCALQGILGERNLKYAKNKAMEAEKACEKVYRVLERGITKGLLPEQSRIMLEAVEVQKSTMYDFFLLDTDDQTRVRGLINKIKNGR